MESLVFPLPERVCEASRFSTFTPERPLWKPCGPHSPYVEIPTVSTWFSTEKVPILLEKTRKCGKLSVGIPGVDNFSTYGTNVENDVVFVENLWIVYEKLLSICG